MKESRGSDAIEARLREELQARGLEVPPEWLDGVVAQAAELRGMAELARAHCDSEAEPAAVFDLDAVIRAGEEGG